MRRLRNRRGATIVLAAIMLTALLGAAAVALDIDRLSVLRNELQTAADAAALAGATQLDVAPDQADASAHAVAARNRALDSAAHADTVHFGAWATTTRTFTAGASPNGADAVRVVTSRTTSTILARLLGVGASRVRASAVAWADAPVDAIHCAKPWFVGESDFMSAFGKSRLDQLTYDDIRTLRDTSGGKHWLTLHMDNETSIVAGNVYAVGLPSPEAGQGPPKTSGSEYRSSVSACNLLQKGWSVPPIPGNKVGPTVQGLADWCTPLAAGICYNASGGIGKAAAISVFSPASIRADGSLVVGTVAGMMIVSIEQHGSSSAELRGYLVPIQEAGPVGSSPSGAVRSILVR